MATGAYTLAKLEEARTRESIREAVPASRLGRAHARLARAPCAADAFNLKARKQPTLSRRGKELARPIRQAGSESLVNVRRSEPRSCGLTRGGS